MKDMKRLLALGLTGTMLCLSLAACGSQTVSSVSSNQSDASTVSEVPVEQPQEIAESSVAEASVSVEEAAPEAEMLGDIARNSFTAVSLPLTNESVTMTAWDYVVPPVAAVISDLGTEATLYTQLQERTGITFEFTTANLLNASDSLALMVAANQLPDITFNFTKFYASSLDQLIEDEIIQNVSNFEDLMPNYFDLLDSNPDVYRAVCTDEGNIATVNSVTMSQYPNSGPVIRQDWLDQLGLEQPKTFADYDEVLAAFQSAGLSQHPMWCPSSLSYSANGVASGFDVCTESDTDGIGGFTYRDGIVSFSITDPGYKDYIAQLADWYSKGYISPDFFSTATSTTASADDISGGAAGIWWSSSMAMNTLSAYDESCDVQPIPAPVQKEGDPMHFDDANPSPVGVGTIISGICQHPELAAQLLDYLYSKEGILLANYGVEGETFNYDENGDPQLTDLVVNNPDGLNFAIAVIKYTSSSDFCSILDPVRNTLAYTDAQKASIDIWTRTAESHLAPGTDWSTDAQTEYAGSLSDVTSYCSTAVMQFVTGDRSMDQWDDFISELESSFGNEIDRCTELYQKAVDAYLGKAA